MKIEDLCDQSKEYLKPQGFLRLSKAANGDLSNAIHFTVQSLYDIIVKYFLVTDKTVINEDYKVLIEIDSCNPFGCRNFVNVKEVLIGFYPETRHIIIRPERGLFFTEELKDFDTLKKIEEQAKTIERLTNLLELKNEQQIKL
jgi:hypothetical protein